MLERIKRIFVTDDAGVQAPSETRSSMGSMGSMGWMGMGSPSGVAVGPSTGLSFSAVYACVNLIANDLATLPINIYRETDDGNQKQPQHDQSYLLRKQPNQLYNSVVYRRTMFVNYLLWGNAYARIHRNNQGRPTRYEILKPWEVEPYIATTTAGREKYYKHYTDGAIIAAEDMIHLADISYDGIKGMSKIAIARSSISLGMNATEMGDSYYKKAGMMSGFLKLKKRLQDHARKALREDFMAQYAGRDNTGSIGILEEDTEYEAFKMEMPFSDAQFLESRKFQVEEIARFFNTPPHKIGHLEKSSFNNIEQQNIEYVINTLAPISKLFEIEHDTKVFLEVTEFIKIELKGLLRGDVAARTEYYKEMVGMGLMSLNEVRALEDMPPVAGGDIHILPLNYTTLEAFSNNPIQTQEE